MRIEDEIAALKRHLSMLSVEGDPVLADRYTMQTPQRPPGLIWQMRWLAGRLLRWLNSKGLPGNEPWPVSLKHSSTKAKAKPLIVWAVGSDADTLRESCDGLSITLQDISGYAPVLVTDVAAFSYYSRLGWLVEYVPNVIGEGQSYSDRKARLLARLYCGAPAVPAHVGLLPGNDRADILKKLLG